MSETKTYRFIYKDSSYLEYDLTRNDFEQVKQAVSLRLTSGIAVSIGLLVVDDVRAVVEVRDKEPPKSYLPDDTPAEYRRYIKEQEELGESRQEDDDVDYT